MKLSDKEDEIVRMYTEQNLNTVQIAKILGCDNTSIGKILKKHNIKRIHKPNELKLTDHDIDCICERYISGETTIEIGRAFSICDNSVSKVLKERGISIRRAVRRSKITKHDYFENIDSVDKAYFLGWMISDGAVVQQPRAGRSDVISLEINSRDRYILELFASVLGADKNCVKDNTNRGHSYLRFASSKMSQDLSKYGVVSRKSFITYLPQLKDELMPHLIRGIFDGDGTVTIDKHKCRHFAFYGSKQLCKDVRNYLHSHIGLNANKVSKTTCYHV